MYQKLIIAGYLGADPETKEVNMKAGGSKTVTKFSVAATTKTGPNSETTEWYRVTAWGATAQACAKYLTKGSPVLVEGTGQTQKWTDKDGNEKTAFAVTADRVQFLPSAKAATANAEAEGGIDEDNIGF